MYGLEEITTEEKKQMLGHFGTVCQMTCLFKDEKGVEEVVKGEQGSLISAKYLSAACDRAGPFTMVHQLKVEGFHHLDSFSIYPFSPWFSPDSPSLDVCHQWLPTRYPRPDGTPAAA